MLRSFLHAVSGAGFHTCGVSPSVHKSRDFDVGLATGKRLASLFQTDTIKWELVTAALQDATVVVRTSDYKLENEISIHVRKALHKAIRFSAPPSVIRSFVEAFPDSIFEQDDWDRASLTVAIQAQTVNAETVKILLEGRCQQLREVKCCTVQVPPKSSPGDLIPFSNCCDLNRTIKFICPVNLPVDRKILLWADNRSHVVQCGNESHINPYGNDIRKAFLHALRRKMPIQIIRTFIFYYKYVIREATEYGRNALMLAVQCGADDDVIRLLLEEEPSLAEESMKRRSFNVRVPKHILPLENFIVPPNNRSVPSTKVRCPAELAADRLMRIGIDIVPDSSNVTRLENRDNKDGKVCFIINPPPGVRGGQRFRVIIEGKEFALSAPIDAQFETMIKIHLPVSTKNKLPFSNESSKYFDAGIPLRYCKSVDTARLLVDRYPQGVVSRDDLGAIPLHYAKSKSMATFLIEEGKKLSIGHGGVLTKTYIGETPFSFVSNKVAFVLRSQSPKDWESIDCSQKAVRLLFSRGEWEILEEMCQTAYEHLHHIRRTKSKSSDSSLEPFVLLHALLELECSIEVLRYAVVLDSSAIRCYDYTGRLPLTIATSMTSISKQTLEILLTSSFSFPAAAGIIDKVGRLPIHWLLDNNAVKSDVDCPVDALLVAAPWAVEVKDPITGLYPFMLAAVKETKNSISTVYKLLQAFPSVLVA